MHRRPMCHANRVLAAGVPSEVQGLVQKVLTSIDPSSLAEESFLPSSVAGLEACGKVDGFEGSAVGSCQHSRRIATHGASELVEYGTVVVHLAQRHAEVVVDGKGGNGPLLLSQIPQFHGEEVSGHEKPAIGRELQVCHGRNNFRVEVPRITRGRCENCDVVVAYGGLASVCNFDGANTGAIGKDTAVQGMAVGYGDHFGEVFHVLWFDVHHIKNM
mmetsp:Transcript_8024/g.22775  ORF Transcript_8024/g.22775 Transcript_8024/m.22775 type:complete len:216 (+) Transcript_8024:470-1117(+)